MSRDAGHDHIVILVQVTTSGWYRRFAGPALALDQNNNVIVAGITGHSMYVAKRAAADGALLWEKSYHGPSSADSFYDEATAVTVDRSGNVIMYRTVLVLPINSMFRIRTIIRPSMPRPTGRFYGTALQWYGRFL